MDFDRQYIQISLHLLKRIIGTTFPNPPVVSIIVESEKNYQRDKIVGFGVTGFGGRPHAEAIALKNIKYKKNKVYTLYSTLEPCCHEGRDHSCVSKILKGTIHTYFKNNVFNFKRNIVAKGQEIHCEYNNKKEVFFIQQKDEISAKNFICCLGFLNQIK